MTTAVCLAVPGPIVGLVVIRVFNAMGSDTPAWLAYLYDRTIAPPFDKASDSCIGCGACVSVCPTGHVESADDGPLRRMATWQTDIERAKCERCGGYFSTDRQVARVGAKLGEQALAGSLCPACRRSEAAARLVEASVAAFPVVSAAGDDPNSQDA